MSEDTNKTERKSVAYFDLTGFEIPSIQPFPLLREVLSLIGSAANNSAAIEEEDAPEYALAQAAETAWWGVLFALVDAWSANRVLEAICHLRGVPMWFDDSRSGIRPEHEAGPPEPADR